MASERLVECQDCGYRWESSADSPRCSKSDCGRSRNVEPVADDVDDQDESEDVEQTVDDDRPEPDPVDDELEDDQGDEDGYSPAFETTQTRSETEPTAPDDVEGDQDGREEESTSSSSDDGPEPEGPDEVPELDPETLETAFSATFDAVAISRGDHWKLDDDESEQLAEGWTPVINHYAPYLFKQYTEVGVAVMITAGIVGPRVVEDREQAKREAKAEEDTEQTGTVREPRIEMEEEPIDQEPDIEQEPAPAETATAGGYANV